MDIRHECAERTWLLGGAGTFIHVWTAEIDGREWHYGEITDSAEVEPWLFDVMFEAFDRAARR